MQDDSKPFILQEEEITETKWITKDELFDQKISDNCLNALKKYFNRLEFPAALRRGFPLEGKGSENYRFSESD